MTLEQAIQELKKYSIEFAQIQDPKTMIAQNKGEFLQKWTKVMQYYNYAMGKVEQMSDQWFDILDIVGDISIVNPELEEWVDLLFEQPKEKTQKENKENDTFSQQSLTNQIESFVSEINNMQYWDPNNIEDIEWQLQEYQKMLISNQQLVEPTLYQSLMNDINMSLNKISNFNKMVNSDTMESIRRM